MNLKAFKSPSTDGNLMSINTGTDEMAQAKKSTPIILWFASFGIAFGGIALGLIFFIGAFWIIIQVDQTSKNMMHDLSMGGWAFPLVAAAAPLVGAYFLIGKITKQYDDPEEDD